MGYEFSQADAYGLATAIGADTQKRGAELSFRFCPYCHGGKHQDEDTFSINLETGLFKCLRASCDEHGHFVRLARDMEYPLDFGDGGRKREYRNLPQRPVNSTPAAIAYLESRGISRATAERYKITTQKGKSNILVFPFYDASNILRFVKYRKTDFDKSKGDKNKEWSESQTMPILFGMQECSNGGTLVITEGQIDSLTVADCGIQNAVSVPTGANGMTWVENCWDFLQWFDEIVIFGDNEHGHITLVEKIAERITTPIRVVRQCDYYGEKDANDILRKYGRQAIVDAVHNAEELVVDHIEDLADVKSVDLYTTPKVKTGFPEIDRIIGGMYYGQVILLTGKRGEGKSTLMSQIFANALEAGKNSLAYSGELTDYHFKRWLDLQLTGDENLLRFVNTYGDYYYDIPADITEKINNWYRGRAYIYDNSTLLGDDEECVQLLDTIELAIQRHGISFVCIDNLMTALDVDLDKDIYRAQSKFLKRLKKIAVRYNIVVLLVAHPKKTRDDVVIEDISGSGDIANRVDVVMSYSRTEDGGKLEIFKNRLTGKTAMKENAIKLYYSEKSKQITSARSGKWVYGWSKPKDTFDESEDLPF